MSGRLNHGESEILAALLVASSHASDATPPVEGPWPVYISSEPNLPDNALFTKDTAPRVGGFNMPDAERHTLYGVQLKVRAKDYPTGKLKFNQLAVALDGFTGEVVTIGASTYTVTVTRVGEVPLGYNKPKDDRYGAYLNVLMAITMTAG